MTFILPSELTKHNVTECLNIAKSKAAEIKNSQLNLKSITKIDSAGIALLLELKNKFHIVLHDPSPIIMKLADLYQIKLES